MLYFSTAYTASNDPDGWKPIILWNNILTAAMCAATTEDDPLYPASNLANVSTAERWQATDTTDGYLTFLFGATYSINSLLLERHNFGSGLTQLTIETLPVGGNPATPSDWVSQKAAFTPTDDTMIWLRWVTGNAIGVRVKYEPASEIPYCAVAMVGLLLSLPQGIPLGHTPITMGRRTEKAGPKSQGGNLLGKIVISSELNGSISQRDIDPTYFRTYIDPFRLASDEVCFGFSWAPFSHPDEVAYCEVTNDPIPVISQKPGHFDITFEISAVVDN